MNQKKEKFRQLAERRTNSAIEAIVRIGKLSNRQAYEFEEAEVRKILKALREAVNEVEGRFAAPSRRAERRFSL
jgi:hypothetical protein